MKIIQIIPTLGVGGAEAVCESLTKSLSLLGHDVTVISLYSENTIITERLINNGNKLIFLDKQTGIDIKCVRRLRRLINEIKPDVIHTHLYALKYAVLASLGKNITIVHTVHNVALKESNKINRIVNKLIFSLNMATPVALSKEIKETVKEIYYLSDDRIPIILNGIDLSLCKSKKDYLLKDPIKIIHVGRFFEQKNHEYIIECAKQLSTIKNIEISFFGDGPCIEKCIQLVKNYNLEDVILFKGVSSNIYNELNNSDIFILPSKWEGVPISIIEAMGTGLPIIASNVGGISDMIINGQQGILIDPNTNELTEALLRLIDDFDLRKEIGINAKKMSTEFSVQTMSQKYLKLYKERS